MIFENFLLNDKYAKGVSTLWLIYWKNESDVDGSDMLVPYAVIREDSPIGEKRHADIQRRCTRFSSSNADVHKSLNAMLSICRETRKLALDPVNGRYASLPVLLMGRYDIGMRPDRPAVTGERVLVHPHRDVFLFSDSFGCPSVSSTHIVSLHDGASFSVREIARILHNHDLPYEVDIELLRAATARTGFRFRHILLTGNFVTGDADIPLNPWILVHICENTDLRAHRFVVFLPCHDEQSQEDEIFAERFVCFTRRLGYYPLGPPPWLIHEQHDCECYEWPDRQRIFYDRPRVLEILDDMREAGMDDELDGQD